MTESKLYRYVQKRGVSVTMIRIFKQRRYNGIVIRLNVEADGNETLVEEPYFWPRGVTCRPWTSNARYQEQRNGNEGEVRDNRYVHAYSSQAQAYPHYVDLYNPYLYPDTLDVD